MQTAPGLVMVQTPGVGSGGGQAKGAVDDAARKVSQKVGGR